MLMGGSMQAQPMQSRGPFVNTLMPQPAQLRPGSGRLTIGQNFSASMDKFHDDRLDAAVVRDLQTLKFNTGVILPSRVKNGGTAALVVSVDGPGEAIQGIDENESYSLEIDAQGAHLHAATDVGAMRGLQTLLQLVQSDGHGSWLPAVTIQDSPRFRWRGLMIDCGRHFEPVDKIERTLDAMAAV